MSTAFKMDQYIFSSLSVINRIMSKTTLMGLEIGKVRMKLEARALARTASMTSLFRLLLILLSRGGTSLGEGSDARA